MTCNVNITTEYVSKELSLTMVPQSNYMVEKHVLSIGGLVSIMLGTLVSYRNKESSLQVFVAKLPDSTSLHGM